ncbi:Hypothetical predicted protein, partial [Scomber scombrus]
GWNAPNEKKLRPSGGSNWQIEQGVIGKIDARPAAAPQIGKISAGSDGSRTGEMKAGRKDGQDRIGSAGRRKAAERQEAKRHAGRQRTAKDRRSAGKRRIGLAERQDRNGRQQRHKAAAGRQGSERANGKVSAGSEDRRSEDRARAQRRRSDSATAYGRQQTGN